MASNPPFQVEDQNDEDFFDRLVEDDDDYKVIGSPKIPNLGVDDVSDEVKAFANLSIGELGSGSGNEVEVKPVKPLSVDSQIEETVEPVKPLSVDSQLEETVDAKMENSSSLVSSNSFAFDGVVESNDDVIDSTANASSGSASAGVKEVQWSAFNADATQDGSNGFGSYSDFLTDFGDDAVEPCHKDGNSLKIESKVVSAYTEDAQSYPQYQEGQTYIASTEQSAEGQDQNSGQYWENMYPGWKYDPNTEQWYQVDGYNATTNVQGDVGSDSSVSYLQQVTPTVVETIAENVAGWNQVSQVSDTSGSVENWNQGSQGNNGYPSHMVFDPQYPGWYYDTITQEWRALDTYTSSTQSTSQAQDGINQNWYASTGTSHVKDQIVQGEYVSEGFSNQGQEHYMSGSLSNINNMWQPETAGQNVASTSTGNYEQKNHYDPKFSGTNHVSPQKSHDYGLTAPLYEKSNQVQNEFFVSSSSQGFSPGGNFEQQFNQPRIENPVSNNYYDNQPRIEMPVSSNYYDNQNSLSYSQQPFQSGQQVSYAPSAGRSSAGRPPHALVTFGFGGKLLVMKEKTTTGNLAYVNQESVGGPLYVHNLADVVNVRADASNIGSGVYDYFHSLNRQSLPGPLTGGSVGVKELNKWIDEKVAHTESSHMDYRKAAGLRLLFSLLKIACQHYGKLRSPFGTDSASKENDGPESAVAKLFASAKRNGGQFSEYGGLAHCLQQLPPEGQIRATAAEVQNLLVSGRKKEALHCAQEGQLWGPALVLATQLGDQFYVDTVKQMALRQLVAGSPLRTLCLLIAGQPADVFSSTDATPHSDIYSAVNTYKQPVQLGANSMLNDWEENLAVMTANRTKDDELVLIHLGDCLWKERNEIIAAHICYLVAEANFELYSDSARLCLVGADHWKFPRTYASPEAIQRTEIYEYSKGLGNSQFVLLPFQPYKLIYAHMLAEVGRVSDSLKYCQAVSKSLKTGRAPEVDVWRQLVSSLEDRIRTHQQGGFSTNLAPAKLVGKLLNLFDSTAHRVVGGLPPPIPSTSVGSVQGNDNYYQSMGPRVSTSQSTMAMSSLMPSTSMEPINEWAADGNKRTIQNRSVSEPDFSRTPKQDQVDSSKGTTPSTQGKMSRFGRFGFGSQLLQKTVDLVLKSRQDKQAKLGDSNKFYYNEKLKMWVEEGVDPPAEEPALPPPPTIGALPNGTSDYNMKGALKGEGPHSNGSPEYKSPSPQGHGSGIPPIPPSSNQFSARGRIGVRSRYVDTFNQGGGNTTNSFQPPAVPSIKSPTTNPTFFVPTPAAIEPLANTMQDTIQQDAPMNENPSVPAMNDLLQSRLTSSSPLTMQRFASMDNISNKATTANNSGASLSSLSRRTASWSGSINDAYSPPSRTQVKPPSSFMPTGPPMTHSSMNGGSYGDDLHEVEL